MGATNTSLESYDNQNFDGHTAQQVLYGSVTVSYGFWVLTFLTFMVVVCAHACVCVCVRICERVRARMRARAYVSACVRGTDCNTVQP